MLWAMMRFYLLSIALVFCGYTNGFNVWNRTSILDWQAGRSNVTWSQNVQFATPGQLLELPSRKGPNGNDGRANFGNPMLTSEVQPAQHDSSFVQSSGGVAQIKQILNAYGQTAPSHHPNDAPQPSQLYWNEFIKPGNCGPLPSQQWPAKNLPGFQTPSSSQPAGTINQVSESWAQSPYQPNSTPVSADLMSSSLAQSSGALTWLQNASSRRYLTSQSIPSSSQSVVTTNQISESQTHLPYQSSCTGTTTSVSTSQSDSTAQPQGSNRTKSSETAKWYRVLQGKMIPSSSKVLGFQTPLYQASSPTPFSAGQSAFTFQAQGPSASTPFQGQALSWHVSQDQSIPSSQAVVTTNPTQSSYQPSLPTQALAGQSASSQEQPLNVSAAYPLQASGWYTISQGWKMPSSSQVSGFQAQSYQPGTATQGLLGQPASPVQSIGDSTLYQASGRYLASPGQSIPSSQSVITTGQVTDAQAQSSQPSITWALGGQSSSQDQSLQALAAYPLQTSGWYTILLGKMIPTSQVSSSTQGLPASSAPLQLLDASTWYQMQGSSRYLSQNQSNPLSSQSVATLNQTSGFQDIYWPNTPVSTSQTISLPQSSSASQLFQGQTSGMSSISQDQSIPSSSQSVDTSGQIAQSQTSLQPSTTTQVLTGQSALAPAQSLRNSPLCSSQTPSWYTTLQGKLIPSSQITTLQQPSTTSQSAASSPAQSMRDLPLYQGQTSYSNLTSQYQRTPSSFVSVAALNQISGIQNQSLYWPNTIQLAPSQFAFTSQSQSSDVPAKGLPNISEDQSNKASLQSVPSTNQISGFQNQTSYWPSATQVLPGDSHIAPIPSVGNSVSYPSQTSGWYTFLQSKVPSSQMSGFQAPSLYQPSTEILAGQSDSTALLPSSGPMLYQGQALSRYNISQDQSFPSSSLSVATTNQISRGLSQPSFNPHSTVASASKSSTSQAQSSGASAWYQGPTFGFLTSQSQNIPSSSQSVVPANQFPRFQNLIQSNAAHPLSQSASTSQGAPQKIAGIPFQGSLPQIVSKKWPVTQ